MLKANKHRATLMSTFSNNSRCPGGPVHHQGGPDQPCTVRYAQQAKFLLLQNAVRHYLTYYTVLQAFIKYFLHALKIKGIHSLTFISAVTQITEVDGGQLRRHMLRKTYHCRFSASRC